MEQKKTRKPWPRLLAGLLLLGLVLWMGFSFVMDPYGAYGDRFFHWWGYNETQNPRLAKLAYLEEHPEYDAFVLGGAGASAYPVPALNAYLDASFYNCCFDTADPADWTQTARYLFAARPVKALVLELSLDSLMNWAETPRTLAARPYYKAAEEGALGQRLAYLFADPLTSGRKLVRWLRHEYLPQYYRAYDETTGALDRITEDLEPIGDLEAYLQAHPRPTSVERALDQRAVDAALACAAELRDLCAEKGASFTVILRPAPDWVLEELNPEEADLFRSRLARIADFWDFSQTSLSGDPRYFYPDGGPRTALGAMVLARIFGDDSLWTPADFGTPGKARTLPAETRECRVPVLMYHNLAETEAGSGTVLQSVFAAQMEALDRAGYTTVTFPELRAWVEEGADLPENPILITFDDGYASNYRLAYPILKEHGFRAAIFAIGVSVGKDTYKDTGVAMTPHFSADEAREMEASGLIDVESHGYDIHEVEGRDPEPIRQGVTRREEESEPDYVAFLREDCRRMEAVLGKEITVLSYPYGMRDALSEAVLAREGIYATLITQEYANVLVRGLPQCLRQLCRLNVDNSMTGQDLLDKLANAALR